MTAEASHPEDRFEVTILCLLGTSVQLAPTGALEQTLEALLGSIREVGSYPIKSLLITRIPGDLYDGE